MAELEVSSLEARATQEAAHAWAQELINREFHGQHLTVDELGKLLVGVSIVFSSLVQMGDLDHPSAHALIDRFLGDVKLYKTGKPGDA